ncbi:MAG: hypothetical protein HQL38_17925, partial [Alphaproteobacteria bacterium]|nr:hypothetical protein [Alphaproteobacteria bacterium]
MTDWLAHVLEAPSPFLERLYAIQSETSGRIAALLGGAEPLLQSKEHWRRDLARDPRLDPLREMLHRFPLVRQPFMVEPLWGVFLLGRHALPEGRVTFAFCDWIQRHEREARRAASAPGTHLLDDVPVAWPSSCASMLRGLFDLASALPEQSRTELALAVCAALNGVLGTVDYVPNNIVRTSVTLAKTPLRLRLWLRALAGYAPLARAAEPPLGMTTTMHALSAIESTGWAARHRPTVLAEICATAQRLHERFGWAAATVYLRHAPRAVRIGKLEEMTSVTEVCAGNGLLILRWDTVAPRLIRRRWPLGEVAEELRAFGGGAPSPRMFHPLAAHPMPSWHELRSLWRTASELSSELVPLSANRLLECSATVRRRHGEEGLARWLGWGRRLARTARPQVGAWFLARVDLLGRCPNMPDDSWFENVAAAAKENPASIAGVASFLGLCGRRDGGAQLARWRAINERLAERWSDWHRFGQWRIGERAASVDATDLALWDKFAATGYRCFLTKSWRTEIVITRVEAPPDQPNARIAVVRKLASLLDGGGRPDGILPDEVCRALAESGETIRRRARRLEEFEPRSARPNLSELAWLACH